MNDVKVLFPNPIAKNGTLNLIVASETAANVYLRLLDVDSEELLFIQEQVFAGRNLVQMELGKAQIQSHAATVQVVINNRLISRKIFIND